MIVYFHLGAHKTASSLIQHRLKRLNGRVGPHRFAYAENDTVARGDWGKWCRRKAPTKDETTRAVKAFKRDIAALMKDGPDAIVLSAEGFLGGIPRFSGENAYPSAKMALENFFTLANRLEMKLDVRPIFYIRRTSRFYESCLSQRFSMGHAESPEEAFAAIRPETASWQPIIADIEAASGRQIPVRTFETIAQLGPAGFVAEFLAALGLGPATSLQREIALGHAAERLPAAIRKVPVVARFLRPNVGLSARGAEMVERLRPLVTKEEWHAIVRPVIRRHFSALKDPGPTYPLPDDLARRLDAVYDEDLKALSSRLTLSYPAPAGSRS